MINGKFYSYFWSLNFFNVYLGFNIFICVVKLSKFMSSEAQRRTTA